VGCILSEAVWPGAYGAGKLHSRYLLVEEEAASAGQVNHQALQMHQILYIWNWTENSVIHFHQQLTWYIEQLKKIYVETWLPSHWHTLVNLLVWHSKDVKGGIIGLV